jgi:hypothetical protein
MQDHPCAKVGGAFAYGQLPHSTGHQTVQANDGDMLVVLASTPVEALFEPRRATNPSPKIRTTKCSYTSSSEEGLATQSEFLNQGSVAIEIFSFEIVEKAASLTHDPEQTAA